MRAARSRHGRLSSGIQPGNASNRPSPARSLTNPEKSQSAVKAEFYRLQFRFARNLFLSANDGGSKSAMPRLEPKAAGIAAEASYRRCRHGPRTRSLRPVRTWPGAQAMRRPSRASPQRRQKGAPRPTRGDRDRGGLRIISELRLKFRPIALPKSWKSAASAANRRMISPCASRSHLWPAPCRGGGVGRGRAAAH